MKQIRFRQAGFCAVCMLLYLSAGAAPPSSTVRQQTFARMQSQAQQWMEQGRLEQAARAYDALIKQDPGYLPAYNNLAVIYGKQGKLEAARDTLRQGLLAKPEVAAMYENLNSVFVELSRNEYGKALRLDIKPRAVKLKTLSSGAQNPDLITQGVIKRTASPGVFDQGTAAVTPLAERKAIDLTLKGWASAWSAQQVDLYLSFYSEAFVPPRDLSRAVWEAQRRKRLTRPSWVEVKLSDIKIKALDKKQISVLFLQDYRSESYRDRTRKELRMIQSEQGWRIVAEHSL